MSESRVRENRTHGLKGGRWRRCRPRRDGTRTDGKPRTEPVRPAGQPASGLPHSKMAGGGRRWGGPTERETERPGGAGEPGASAEPPLGEGGRAWDRPRLRPRPPNLGRRAVNVVNLWRRSAVSGRGCGLLPTGGGWAASRPSAWRSWLRPSAIGAAGRRTKLASVAGVPRDTVSGIQTGRARLRGRAVGSVLRSLDIPEWQLGELFGDVLRGTPYQHCSTFESRPGVGLSGYIDLLRSFSDDGLLEEVGHERATMASNHVLGCS